MVSPESARAEVARLVAEFNALSPKERRTYNEAATRQRFILPLFRALNLDDADERALHDRMVALVEEMLRLKREHAAAEAAKEDRRHALARQIQRTDRDIDALVYQLYGLTEEEIAIVEGE